MLRMAARGKCPNGSLTGRRSTSIDACLSPIQAFWFTAFSVVHGRHNLLMEKMTNWLTCI